MEKLNKYSEFSLIFKYALKDLGRNYKKISSIILTLFASFINYLKFKTSLIE